MYYNDDSFESCISYDDINDDCSEPNYVLILRECEAPELPESPVGCFCCQYCPVYEAMADEYGVCVNYMPDGPEKYGHCCVSEEEFRLFADNEEV